MNDFVYHNSEIDHTYFLLIPPYDGLDARILVEQAGDHWTLPHFTASGHHHAAVQQINDFCKQHLHLDTAVLRCLHTTSEAPTAETRYYALDNLQPDWHPPQGMQWITAEQSQHFHFAAQQQQVLLNWFSWLDSDSPQHAPWTRRGWFKVASRWTQDLADRLALTGLHEVKQIRAWARSSILRLSTDTKTLYLKAVSAESSYEPVVTRVLSIRYPQHSPDVQAVHVDQGWMLTSEFEGVPLHTQQKMAIWERVVQQYAEMQIDMIGSATSLISLGVPDRNVDYLSSQIERLTNDLPTTLTTKERYEFKQISSQLRTMCIELTEKNIPLTLTHGDLWSGNIIIRKSGHALFFDWSDASVSHPFFDLPILLANIELELRGVLDVRERLIRTYLQPWTKYHPFDRLRAAYALAETLTFLHQATFYHVHILPCLESSARWEVEQVVPDLLRKILKTVRPGSAQLGSETTRMYSETLDDLLPGGTL